MELALEGTRPRTQLTVQNNATTSCVHNRLYTTTQQEHLYTRDYTKKQLHLYKRYDMLQIYKYKRYDMLQIYKLYTKLSADKWACYATQTINIQAAQGTCSGGHSPPYTIDCTEQRSNIICTQQTVQKHTHTKKRR